MTGSCGWEKTRGTWLQARVGVVVRRGLVVFRQRYAVVADKDDERLVGDLLLVEQPQDLAEPSVVVADAVDIVGHLAEAAPAAERDHRLVGGHLVRVVRRAGDVREKQPLVVPLGRREGVSHVVEQRRLLEAKVVDVGHLDGAKLGGRGAQVARVDDVFAREAELLGAKVRVVESEGDGLEKVRPPLGAPGGIVLCGVRLIDACECLKKLRETGLVDVVQVFLVQVGDEGPHAAHDSDHALEGIRGRRKRIVEVDASSAFLLLAGGGGEPVLEVAGEMLRGRC